MTCTEHSREDHPVNRGKTKEIHKNILRLKGYSPEFMWFSRT